MSMECVFARRNCIPGCFGIVSMLVSKLVSMLVSKLVSILVSKLVSKLVSMRSLDASLAQM